MCRFYCEPCEQCVCVLCALHEHNEHEVSSLADGLERHRATFSALLDECKTRIDVMREQQTLADSFRSSLTAAEDCIQHAAIDAIAAVRRRERELLEGLRSFVGDDAMRFLGEGDSLGVRLRELESVRETMETMIGRSSVELLMTKKDVHQRLRTALDRHEIQTPDRVRVGAVQYTAGAEPFRDLHQPTSHITELFRSVVDDDAVDSHVTDRSTSSSSSSDSDSYSKGSDSEDEGLHPGTVRVVSQLPQLEHVSLVARSRDASGTEESGSDEEESGKDDEGEVTTKICICDGVVRRMVIRSQSVCDALPPPPRPTGKIPDFSRPKPPAVTFVDHGTEMERVETTDVATATTRVIVSDKETYTGYVYLVHKNVSTDNQGTADKATSTATDVTAAYRNLSTAGRSTMITRGTNTMTATAIDRASSPIAAPRPPTAPASTPAALTKLSAYPTNQRSGGAQAMSVEQKSSTSDVVSVTTSPVASVAGRVLADNQKPPGAVNATTQRAPPATSSTALPAQQPVAVTTTTTSQKQPSPTSGKLPLPPSTQKPVTSPAITTATPSPAVTSLPQLTPPSVATVASPLQRKPAPPPPLSAGSVTSSTATVMSPATQPQPPSVALAGTTSLTAAVQKPMTSPKLVTSPSTASVTNTTSQPVPAADISQSVINGRQQAVSSTSAAVPANVRTALPVTSSITVPTTAAVTSSLLASTQTSMTPQQPPWSRQSQLSPGTLPPAVVLPQSISSTAQPVAVTSAPQTTRQITSPLTQVPGAVQQRTASTALTSSPTTKTSPQQPPTGVDVTAAAPAPHKLMTSAVSQSQTTSKTSPTSVTSLPSQPQTTSPSTTPVASSTLANCVSSTTTQKLVTSLVSPTIQPQSLNALTTSIATTPQTVTSPTKTSTNHAATSVPLVFTTAQIPMTSTARSPVQTSAAVTSSVTTQFRHPTTAQTVTPRATTSNNQVPNASASVQAVSTGAQKPMTSNSGQQETVTSPSSQPVATENSATASQLAAPSSVQTPASPVSRQRSVFRSFSMENVRTTAPVLRLPPPIMTSSVAAVTQRLNSGAVPNGSAKNNNWRPANSNR